MQQPNDTSNAPVGARDDTSVLTREDADKLLESVNDVDAARSILKMVFWASKSLTPRPEGEIAWQEESMITQSDMQCVAVALGKILTVSTETLYTTILDAKSISEHNSSQQDTSS